MYPPAQPVNLVEPVASFADGHGIQARSLGVLPWCVKPDGEVVILLGREASSSSLRWAPFEGSAKPGETCEQGAGREWIEESLGLVPFFHAPPAGRFTSVAAAGAALATGAYSHRVQLRFRLRMRSQAWKEATTIVAQVA